MANLGNYPFLSIVMDMAVEITILETENGKWNRTSMRGTIYTEWVRDGHKCERKIV